MSKLKEIQRREFLKFLGLAGGAVAAQSPLEMLMEAFVRGQISKAQAQEAGSNPRRFLNIQWSGAPQRWVYDLFVNPKGSNGFAANKQVASRYVLSNGRYTTAEYQTVTTKGIEAPWMWQFDIPTPGGSAPMSALMDNMLALQGIDVGSSSHSTARRNYFLPLTALQSMTGMVADASSAPIKAINYQTSSFVFRSSQGYSYVSPSGSNLISSLMQPFNGSASSNFISKRDAIKNIMDRATASLDNYASSDHPGATTLGKDRASAEELLAQNFNDLSTFWTNGVNKYRSLMQRAIDPGVQFAGLTDNPIGAEANRDSTYKYRESNGADVLSQDADMRDMIVSGRTISRLAEEFTLAEFVFTRNLSHSMSVRPSALSIQIDGSNRSVSFDEHNVGVMVSLLTNTMHYRAFSACLLEFINSMKAAGIFNDTVICVNGDFNRSPRNNGDGSDHGRYSGSFVYYSGAIQGPLVLGEIRGDSSNSTHRGSWGEGRRKWNIGNVMASAAVLLQVPPPITARIPMIADQGGNIVGVAEESDLV